jgi:hypothetical protein
MHNFLDEDQIFIRGTWRGETLDLVADEVPDYIQYLLDECDLTSDEQELMEDALRSRREEEFPEEEEEDE